MARPLRIEYPNASYHLTNRGDDRKRIFPSSRYMSIFLEGLEQACKRLNVQVHAYSILSNEYHLLVTTPEGNLSRFMRQVDGLYTQAYQWEKGQAGSVFRSRYKAVLVQAESYLLPLSRYIHLLPEKKKQNSANYPYSSIAFYKSKAKGPGFINTTEVFAGLKQSGQAQTPRAYAKYLAEGVDDEIARVYAKKNLQSVLGDKKFQKFAKSKLSSTTARGISRGAAAKKRPSLKAVVEAVATEFKVTEKSIYKAARGPGSKNIPRWVAMYLGQEVSGVTLDLIARRFGLQRYGTVSTTIGKLKDEIFESPRLAAKLKRLESRLRPAT